MQMKLIASLLLLSVFSNAHARVIYSSGAWDLDDTSDRKNPNAPCLAYTQVEDGGKTYRLEFLHAKGLPGPTDFQIRIQGSNAPTSFTATLKDEVTVLAFANGGEVAKRQSVLWNIPQNTGKLIAQLEDRKDLKIRPADGSRDRRIEFDSDGFKRVKEKMQEKCLGNAEMYDLAFEEAFVLKRDPINPLGITPEQVLDMRKTINSAYSIHLGINGTAADLIKLKAKFQAQLNEKDMLIGRIAQLGDRDIPSNIQASQNNDSTEANAKTQLQQVNTTIAQQQSALAAAQTQLSTARNIIAPFEAEHADRLARARTARSNVNYGAQRLSEIDNGIRNSEYRINQLSQEAGSIQNANVRIDNDLHYARQNRQRAEMEARNFDPRAERMYRLSRDSHYQQSRREIPQLQNNIQIIENGLNDAKGRLLARQTELRVCQTRTSFLEKSSLDRVPAQERPRGPNYNPDRPRDGERPDRPNRPGRNDGDNTPTEPTQPTVPTVPTEPTPPTTETVPTTPTAVDCTAEQNAVNAAQQVVSSLEVQHRDARARLNDVERRLDQIERRVDNEIDRIRNDLRERAMIAIRQEENLNSQLSVNIRRLEVIANIEIPQHQNIINALTNERPGVEARYNQEVPVANRLEAELRAFEVRVGWDAKVQAVETAAALVSQRNVDLNRSLSQKAALDFQIARCQQERATLANQLVDLQNRKAQAEARLIVVRQSLEPYDLEKARLEQSQSDLKDQLVTVAQEFEAKLP